MQLTDAGQVFIIAVVLLMVWSFWLTSRWVKRLAQGRQSSKLEFGYLFCVVFGLSALFFPFSYWVPKALYGLATLPTYEATITGYSSEWVDNERTDANNRSYTVRELMHTAELTFKDDQQRQHTLSNSIRSTELPIVGDQITVVYDEDQQRIQEKSMRSILLYIATLFMLFIIGFILLAIWAYGSHRNMQSYTDFARLLVFRVIVPLGTMSMLAMFCYVLFEYFVLGNPKDHPLWAVLICGFFALMLLPVLYHSLTNWKAFRGGE